MNVFFTSIRLRVLFFSDVEAMHDFFFDRTFFNVKGLQRIVQFNYSTAQGDSLFGVSIFANSSIAIIEKEMSY